MELTHAVSNLLFFENRPDVLSKIAEDTMPALTEIAKGDPNIRVRTYAIDALGLTNSEAAVNTIIGIVKEEKDDKTYSDLFNPIQRALFFPDRLSGKYQVKIKEKLDELMKDPNDAVRKRAIELREKARGA